MRNTFRMFGLIVLLAALTNSPGAEPQAASLLRSGPMPAWAEMTSAAVWLQTTRECDVQLRYWAKTEPDSPRLSNTIATTRDGDLIATFVLKDLHWGTRYAYEVYLDGVMEILEWPLEFQTQPHWRWRGDPPEFTFTLGSCMYVNETEFDRPGKPYGGDFELIEALASEQADFMLWMGDNVYLREPDWLTEEGIRHRYAHTRAFERLQRVLATRHNYAIWDDHDYGPNDSDRSYRLKETSLDVFSDYWPAPRYGTDETPGAFQRFEWGDVEFFLLDDRYYRTLNKSANSPGKTIFGQEQLRWLKDALSNSIATFKVVAGGGQMMNPLAPYEGLARVPHEQKEIVDYIVQSKVEGVVFLSGDRHMSELIKVTPEAGYPLYDFTCSPLSSGSRMPKPEDEEYENRARVPGTLVGGLRNYGRIQVLGESGKRKLVLSCHGKDGTVLWTHTIARADLEFAD